MFVANSTSVTVQVVAFVRWVLQGSHFERSVDRGLRVVLPRAICAPRGTGRTRLLRFLSVVLMLDGVCLGAGIDVPLSVRETAGVGRHQWPIRTGLPLPKGALKSLEKLQVLDERGQFVPAFFSVANRWWGDGSIQWLLCDFAATVAANSQSSYVVREIAALPEFPSPMGFIPRGKAFEVITGPLRFVIGGESNQLFDQVWVDEGWGYNFNEQTKILDSGNFDLVLTSEGHSFRTSYWAPPRIEVEEHNALRAVVKITGGFASADSKEPRLDYVARLTTHGGKTYVKLELTLLNRRDEDLPIDGLSLRFKLNLDLTEQKFQFGGEPTDHAGSFEAATQASLMQDTANSYSVLGAVAAKGSGKSERLGWVNLSDGEHGLSAAVKWFSQLYPKELRVRNDSTAEIELFPPRKPSQVFPKRTAKTHELMLFFHGKRQLASGQVKNVMLGFQKPIYAVAPPAWYCSGTQVLGPLLEASSGLLKPEFNGLSAKLDGRLLSSRRAVLEARDRALGSGTTEPIGYGVFRFGQPPIRPEREPGEGTGGDFVHALYLHFLRTGDLQSLDLAEETQAANSDAAMAAERPGDESSRLPQLLGLLGRSHELYGVEGLLDGYLLSGNRRLLKAGLLLAGRVAREGSAAGQDCAGVASRLMVLMKAYEVTGDRQLLEATMQLVEVLYAWQDGDLDRLRRLSPVIASQWQESFKEGLGRNARENGEAWRALRNYQRLSGDRSVFARIRRSAQWIQHNPREWNAEKKVYLGSPYVGLILASGLAAAAEEAEGESLLEQARNEFERALDRPLPIDDPGLFGRVFVSAQYFPWFLSKASPAKRDVSALAGQR